LACLPANNGTTDQYEKIKWLGGVIIDSCILKGTTHIDVCVVNKTSRHQFLVRNAILSVSLTQRAIYRLNIIRSFSKTGINKKA
jgi:hypothetical protein